jgi:isoquinoline 1-oxidoreductase subunit beta
VRDPEYGQPYADGLTRRAFVKLSSAAGLLLGIQLPGCAPAAEDAEGEDGLSQQAGAPGNAAPFAPNAFIRITSDNRVSVVVRYQEMGQGTATGVATLIAEELDADWSLVSVEYAPSSPSVYANPLYGIQGTGGSTAMRGAWNQMRQAGAAARTMLVNAAAASWSVPAAELVVASSTITHRSGKRATFGELAVLAAAQPVPAPADLKLKDPSTFKLIGKANTRRVDAVSKSNGTAQYTIDVKRPGLLTAVIARPPTFSAKLVSYDEAAARGVKGVTDVVKVPEGIAVVATGMHPAIKGRDALKPQWDTSADAGLSSEAILADYRALAKTPGASVTKNEGTAASISGATKTIEAVFEFPFLAHAPMEPTNCVAWLHDGLVETWSAHQLQTIDHQNAAATAGLGMDKVRLNTLMAGGSFGRRANVWSDFTVEAINVAKAIGGRAPVKVQRTREDDTRIGLYRPIYVHAVKVGLTPTGEIAGWQHTVVGQAIYQAGPALGPNSQGNDASSLEGLWPTPYAIPNLTIDLHSPKQVVKPLWFRSVGHTHTAFAVETLLDELAEAAGKDPVAFRMALLAGKPRNANVLKLLAEKSGWGTPTPAGTARGLSLHESFGSVVGNVVEVTLNDDGTPKVTRAVVVVDCGVAINPDVVNAQMEGGLGFGLSAALFGEITIDKGNVQQNNFYDYRVLRIDEMPAVEVHIVPSTNAPTGVGEIAVPPIAPAVANAVYKLSGKRVRRLPFSRLAT